MKAGFRKRSSVVDFAAPLSFPPLPSVIHLTHPSFTARQPSTLIDKSLAPSPLSILQQFLFLILLERWQLQVVRLSSTRSYRDPSCERKLPALPSSRTQASIMSANLDKSLDDLVGSRRQSARRRANRRATAKSATVGGVKKSSKATKPTTKAAHPTPAASAASSKIIVSGLVCGN